MAKDIDIIYMGDKSKPTYAWTASADPELTAYCAFLNAGLPKSFHKMRVRKKRVRGDGRLLPSLWREARARVFARDDYTCRYCGHRGGQLECDHVIAHSRGGTSEDSNLVTACLPCNRSKRDQTLEEWTARRAPHHQAKELGRIPALQGSLTDLDQAAQAASG